MSDKPTYLVTGCSSGMGYDACLELLAQGCVVYGISRRSPHISHENFTHLALDLSANDFIDQSELASIPQLDGILHNAGFLVNAGIEDISAEDLRTTFQVNVFAPFELTKKLIPQLRQGAHVLHVSSMGGFQGSAKFPGLSAYSSSKAAIASLAECLAVELEPHHVRCNALAIGAVDTPMLRTAFPDYQAPVSAQQMGSYLSQFLRNGHEFFNGKVLPVSLSTP